MSLRHMSLRDFVIVETLQIDFESGFTALTGETGAGKSILVDALQLVLGARADVGVVREGASRAELSAEFDTPDGMSQWLQDAGFESDGELLLRRTVDSNGKSRGWINGTPATASQLRELGAALLDIHGQHAWQHLMRAGAVRDLLDAYAGSDRQNVQRAWTAWRAAAHALELAREAQASAGTERERLQWQIAELEKLAPQPDEWERLNEEHMRLGHAQALMDAALAASGHLENDNGGARAALAHALAGLTAQEHLEPRFGEISALLAQAMAQTDETLRELHAYLRRDAPDAAQLQALDDRVALWLSLARRFKRTPAELAQLHSDWKHALALLDANQDLDALSAAEREVAGKYRAAATILSRQRSAAAPKLSASVTKLLQGLGMVGGRFVVQISPAAQAGAAGMDEVEFHIAGHAGQTPRPLAKVASGGELSRIALAIAVTTSAMGSAGTLIFDEVDAGVGGAVAQTVGRLMQQLGQQRQVLAVTHLPQVAACADQHLVVSKTHSPLGASSTVSPSAGAERLAELARMLGGGKTSKTSLAHAREMLEASTQASTVPQ
ncbi:MAG: DNA repair protein RecN [Giesbergeria sp.]